MIHTYKKTAHARNSQEGQGWTETDVNDTLNIFDNGEARTPTLIVKTTVLENHPMDSRIKIKEDGVFQTMSTRGGKNTNLILYLSWRNTWKRRTRSTAATVPRAA